MLQYFFKQIVAPQKITHLPIAYESFQPTPFLPSFCQLNALRAIQLRRISIMESQREWKLEHFQLLDTKHHPERRWRPSKLYQQHHGKSHRHSYVK
jgi:hypothetical protein